MIDSKLKKWELHTRESCTSALDVAREFIEKTELLPEGNAFLVSEQTKGRGRMDRVWISHKNNGMYLSVILSPKRPHSEWPTLSFVASLAALQSSHARGHIKIL